MVQCTIKIRQKRQKQIILRCKYCIVIVPLGDFLCIPTLNTELNPLFHTFAEFRLIVIRIMARQSTDWLAANAQFSPNDNLSSQQYSISIGNC